MSQAEREIRAAGKDLEDALLDLDNAVTRSAITRYQKFEKAYRCKAAGEEVIAVKKKHRRFYELDG